MPRPTYITRKRYRRQRKARKNPVIVLRVAVILLVLLVGLFAFIFVGGVGGVSAVYAYFTRDLPDFTELEKLGQDADTTFETTKIYAWGPTNADGERDHVLIYEIIDPLGGDRQWIPLEQVPQTLIDGTVAIEDQTFWTNQGFDVVGIARAFNEYVLQGWRNSGRLVDYATGGQEQFNRGRTAGRWRGSRF